MLSSRDQLANSVMTWFPSIINKYYFPNSLVMIKSYTSQTYTSHISPHFRAGFWLSIHHAEYTLKPEHIVLIISHIFTGNIKKFGLKKMKSSDRSSRNVLDFPPQASLEEIKQRKVLDLRRWWKMQILLSYPVVLQKGTTKHILFLLFFHLL